MIDQTSTRNSKLDELKQEFDELDVRDRLEMLLDFSDERGQRLVRAMLERLDSAFTDHNLIELMPG